MRCAAVRFKTGNGVALPDLRKIFDPFEILFFLDPAFYAELREDCHHLANRKPGKLRSPLLLAS